ncbi:CAP domain-containing protein [Seonamhaeicola sp. ML3]|uniref:CAP domain-containing protein n=1 Tax=Seonamhaeicola sp. ML3 TaxID=2937786 RepID=UPI00200E0D1B|nr:CAP domain-containing protein [Seonamhaeicola sp. ML3]
MKTLHLKTYSILCFCFIILFGSSCSKDNEITESSETLTFVEEIFQLVNAHRKSIGKQELAFNVLANSLAVEHTLYMIDENDISHDDFNQRSDRLFAEENATKTGENVAFGQRTAQAVMDAWLNSPGHRRNIEGDFTHIGIAAIKNSSGTYYFTQLFLKKESPNAKSPKTPI